MLGALPGVLSNFHGVFCRGRGESAREHGLRSVRAGADHSDSRVRPFNFREPFLLLVYECTVHLTSEEIIWTSSRGLGPRGSAP